MVFDFNLKLRTNLSLLTFAPRLCSPRLDPKLTMKALGILINIIHDSDDAESAVFNHGSGLLAAMVTLLTDNPSNEIHEQVLCVLVNVCNLSVKGRDLLTGSEDIMRCISGLLVSDQQ